MKNLSTGTGLALLAGAALAYPFISSLAPDANASAVTAAAAVSTAATGQGAPTIVWYGCAGDPQGTVTLFRAWSDGRVEANRGYVECPGVGPARWQTNTACTASWTVVSSPASGLTFDADLNFDEAVDGGDLAMMLAKWGPVPRNPVPPSDCPLALINP